MTAGDGFIITVDKSNNVRFIQLDNDVNIANGEAPEYIAYNLNPSPSLYNSNVYFYKLQFSKSKYSSVYVTSDGFRFVLDKRFPENERIMIKRCFNSKRSGNHRDGFEKEIKVKFWTIFPFLLDLLKRTTL